MRLGLEIGLAHNFCVQKLASSQIKNKYIFEALIWINLSFRMTVKLYFYFLIRSYDSATCL